MSWSILPELSAWHAAQLVAHGFDAMHPEVAVSLAPLVERMGHQTIDDQVSALGSCDASTLNDSFALYDAVEAIVPVAEILPVRIRPLQLQWEARGPGMLAFLRRHILGPQCAESSEDVDVPILPVYPWVGGFTQALPESGAVMVEAVLTDATVGLPEVVRLAWGHAQLLSHEAFAAQRTKASASLHALVTIMPTLAAAEHVALATCDAETVAQAITNWWKTETDESTVMNLLAWWLEWSRQTEAGAADWPMAVSALGFSE